MKNILIFFAFFALLFAENLPAQNLGEKMKVKLSFGTEQALVVLEDNEASREFYALLPLELEFSDYVGKEKIAHLKQNLSVKNTPGYEPQIGDFFYFSPWGNLGIFYAKQPAYNGLVYLGRVQNGLEKLKNKKENFKILLEKLD